LETRIGFASIMQESRQTKIANPRRWEASTPGKSLGSFCDFAAVCFKRYRHTLH
jgi:hypothetical protein